MTARRNPPSFTCPRCGMVSFNPNDIAHGYCGNCHAWFGQLTEAEAYKTEEPVDRLTELGDRIIKFLQTQPDLYREGDKIIITVHGVENVGGMAILGYERDDDIVDDMLEYIRRILRVMGKDIVWTKTSAN